MYTQDDVGILPIMVLELGSRPRKLLRLLFISYGLCVILSRVVEIP
jgi:hypothetical protein